MNDNFKELKGRIRRLDELLAARGTGDLAFAQAVSAVRRAEKHGDRSRDPSPELRALLDKAESLGRMMLGVTSG
ncbi:MAG TPA: hypothetical protein VF875_16870 [Anaeromyxobacter sp.]